MRVGADATDWPNRRGYGRFARGILTALAARPDIDLTLIGDSMTVRQIDAPSGVTVVGVTTGRAVVPDARATRSIPDLIRLGRAAAALPIDVMFYPSVASYAPLLGRTPQVVTIHDAIPERLPSLVFESMAGRLAWAAKVRLAIALARRIVTVSAAACRDILRRLPVDPRRLRIVSEAADAAFVPIPSPGQVIEWYRLPQPYVLTVGGISPHKDLPTALRAMAHLPEMRLAIVGEVDGDTFHTEPEAVRAEARRLAVDDRVHWLGYVPDNDLAALYSGAVALLFPSLAEGFGLPVVEAAACGCPVVASDLSGAAAVIGDRVRSFPAGDDVALADHIARLIDGTPDRDQLRERADGFSWQGAADGLARILAEAAGA